jgi:MarR family transcriptional regulator, transcriptional regulator for hemolysin
MMSREKQKAAQTAGNGNETSAVARLAPGLIISRLARQLERALGPLQLSLSQYWILALLGGGSAMSSILADKLAVTPPSITGIVDGLVARGLVERRPDANDRRRQYVAMTNAGTRAFAEAEAAVAECLADILSYLEPREVEAVMDAFRLCELALGRRLEAPAR